MREVYYEVDSLDKRCYEEYGLNEDILMENAAIGLERVVLELGARSLMIVAGGGNNGADGTTLARRLHGQIEVQLHLPHGAKSPMAKIQLERAQKIGVPIVKELHDADVVVDALFGSGLKGEMQADDQALINAMNQLKGTKIACDIPSGINKDANIVATAFDADITVTMGGLKSALLGDRAKDHVGEIRVADLGITRQMYERPSDCFLLEEEDMRMPYRQLKSSHKGNFGHLSVVAGEKKGAAMLCAKAGFALGSGLVTVVSPDIKEVPDYIMLDNRMPKKTTAIAIGMGLGNMYDKLFLKKVLLDNDIPAVIDADIFSSPVIEKILTRHKNLVLTPHPKEFTKVLKKVGLCDIGVEELQSRRFELAREFVKRYDVTLVLKGANTIIAQKDTLYICPLGSPALSKGGSGDVLAGVIAGLLAQGYGVLDASISGVLAHAVASSRYQGNSYAMSPLDLIEELKRI
jgi:hydroxyethylthiazole kinase-like uncharacterized protein yjeF